MEQSRFDLHLLHHLNSMSKVSSTFDASAILQRVAKRQQVQNELVYDMRLDIGRNRTPIRTISPYVRSTENNHTATPNIVKNGCQTSDVVAWLIANNHAQNSGEAITIIRKLWHAGSLISFSLSNSTTTNTTIAASSSIDKSITTTNEIASMPHVCYNRGHVFQFSTDVVPVTALHMFPTRDFHLLALELARNVVIKDRKRHFRTYSKCFVASEAVHWLIGQHHAFSEQEAVLMCKAMEDMRYIESALKTRCKKKKSTTTSDSKTTASSCFENSEKSFYRITSQVKSSSSSSNNNHHNTTESIEQVVVEMKQHIHVRDRRRRFKLYQKCFIASDAINWLIQTCRVSNETEGYKLLKRMERKRMIFNVTGKRSCDPYYYNPGNDDDDENYNRAMAHTLYDFHDLSESMRTISISQHSPRFSSSKEGDDDDHVLILTSLVKKALRTCVGNGISPTDINNSTTTLLQNGHNVKLRLDDIGIRRYVVALTQKVPPTSPVVGLSLSSPGINQQHPDSVRTILGRITASIKWLSSCKVTDNIKADKLLATSWALESERRSDSSWQSQSTSASYASISLPLYIRGRDISGRPVLYFRVSEVGNSFYSSSFHRIVLYTLLRASFLASTNGITLLIDCIGVSHERLPSSLAMRTFINLLSAHFPGLLGKAFIINACRSIYALWQVAKYYIPPATANKITFLSTSTAGSQHVLLEHIATGTLEVEYGGMASRDDFDVPTYFEGADWTEEHCSEHPRNPQQQLVRKKAFNSLTARSLAKKRMNRFRYKSHKGPSSSSSSLNPATSNNNTIDRRRNAKSFCGDAGPEDNQAEHEQQCFSSGGGSCNQTDDAFIDLF